MNLPECQGGPPWPAAGSIVRVWWHGGNHGDYVVSRDKWGRVHFQTLSEFGRGDPLDTFKCERWVRLWAMPEAET